MVTVQEPMPEHAPDQPANWEVGVEAAVSVTCWFGDSGQTQVPPGHTLAVPACETEPEPVTVTETCGGPKLAVTFCAAVIAIEQVVAVPEQPPDQPLNTEPTAGFAERVTVEPVISFVLQVPAPQLTAPRPAPPLTLPLPTMVTP